MLCIVSSRCSLKAFGKGSHIFLGHHTDSLPLFLDFLHSLVLVLPEHFRVLDKFFDLGAKGFLVGQVLLAFRIHLFDKAGAVFLNLFVVRLEVVAIFLQLGSRDRSDFFPAVRNILELSKNGLAARFLGQSIHFKEQIIAVLFVVPVFPLLHFLETSGSSLVFLPQVVILELVFAHDFFPLLVEVANLLVQVAEVFVFVESLYLFDNGLELCRIFFETLLGVIIVSGNLARKRIAQCIVALQHRVFAFQKRKLFPFANNGMQMFLGHVVHIGICQGLKAFQQFRSNRFVGTFRHIDHDFLNLTQILHLEGGVVVTLGPSGIHQGLAFGTFSENGIHAFSVIGHLVFRNQSFEFFESSRESSNLCLLFGFGLFGSDASGIGFVAELLEACINFVNRRLLVAHAKLCGFFHQRFKLSLDCQRFLLCCQEMSLLYKCFALACQEFGRLFTVVFSIFSCADSFTCSLTNFGLSGALCDILEQGVGGHLACSRHCNIFVQVAVSGKGQDRLLGTNLYEFCTNETCGVHTLEQIFGIVRILNILQISEILGARLSLVFKLFDNFFQIASLSSTLHFFVGIVFRNLFQSRNDRQLLYGSNPYRSIGIGLGNTFQNILVVRTQFSDSFQSLFRVGILPLRFKGVK